MSETEAVMSDDYFAGYIQATEDRAKYDKTYTRVAVVACNLVTHLKESKYDFGVPEETIRCIQMVKDACAKHVEGVESMEHVIGRLLKKRNDMLLQNMIELQKELQEIDND